MPETQADTHRLASYASRRMSPRARSNCSSSIGQPDRNHVQGIDRHLLRLAGQPIARKVANTLTLAMLVQHAQGRREFGIKPSTTGVDFSLIRTVLEAARDANLISLDPEVVDRARKPCKSDRFISAGGFDGHSTGFANPRHKCA
jgi:hypothetical protein